jgi:hypothetical protein
MIFGRRVSRGSSWAHRLVAIGLILALAPGCQFSAAQFYIPLAYAVTGMCVALLMSPTFVAGAVGLMLGGLIGAAVYNNSLKRQIQERQRSDLPPR